MDVVGVVVDADDLPDLPRVAEPPLHLRVQVVAGDDDGDERLVGRRVDARRAARPRRSGRPTSSAASSARRRPSARSGRDASTSVELAAADVEAAGRRHRLRAGDQAVGDPHEARAQVRGERVGGHAGTRWLRPALDQAVGEAQGERRDGVRRVDAAGGDEDAAVDDVEVVDVVRPAPRVDDRGRRVGAHARRAEQVPAGAAHQGQRVDARARRPRAATRAPARRGSRAAGASSPTPCTSRAAPGTPARVGELRVERDAVVARRAGPRRRCPSSGSGRSARARARGARAPQTAAPARAGIAAFIGPPVDGARLHFAPRTKPRRSSVS